MLFDFDFDLDFLKKNVPTLSNARDEDILKILYRKLLSDGVPSSPHAYREYFLQTINARTSSKKIEIGPFDNPKIVGENVAYFDVLDADQLRIRAQEHGRNHNQTPHIDYVDENGDLSIISDKFDLVFSSHCIEHQVDFIKHLDQVANILTETGECWMIIPDKNYCFDHYFDTSSIADILDARISGRNVHSLKSLVEHSCLITHNDALRHWLGDHGVKNASLTKMSVQNAISKFDVADGQYIDVHAWQFTPQSFLELMQLLYELGLSRFSTVMVNSTPFPRQEFTVRLGL